MLTTTATAAAVQSFGYNIEKDTQHNIRRHAEIETNQAKQGKAKKKKQKKKNEGKENERKAATSAAWARCVYDQQVD